MQAVRCADILALLGRESTARCLEHRSHNGAGCSAASLVRVSRRKASLSVAQ